LNSKDSNWKQNAGGDNSAKWNEWADNAKWKTDKGNGYEKAYSYDKSDGSKNAYGKDGQKKDGYHKSSKGFVAYNRI